MHLCRGSVRFLAGAATMSHLASQVMVTAAVAGNAGSHHTPRVLAIQSHTVHGYVGNKAATFPLQCLGFNVDAINSISLSNHPGYKGGCKGKSLSSEDFESIVQGLDGNDLLHYDIVLTGYTRSVEIAEQTAKTIARIIEKNPNVMYVLDPVLGDDGRFYVPSEIAECFKTSLLPLASIVVPNQFEAEVLSGLQITSIETAREACSAIHSHGSKLCILKGLHLDKNDYSKLSIVLSIAAEVCSEEYSLKGDSNILLRLDIPKISGKFSGCGDLFTALVAGLLSKTASEKEKIRLASITQLADEIDNGNGAAGDINMKLAPANALFLDRWSVEDLALVLEHAASAMHDVISSTKYANSNELRIVESLDSYLRISQPLKEIPRSAYFPDDEIAPLNIGELFASDSPESALAAAELRSLKRLPFPSAYLASAKITGVIFDMDGTLTEPGAINFTAMYRRCGLNKADGDLVSQIDRVADPVRRAEMYAIVKDEEMKGCERMKLRPDLFALLESLHRARIRAAISTRNCQEAYIKFLQATEIPLDRFAPALTRESLNGINKPDPRVASHIVSTWETSAETTWFVGDSEDDMRCGKDAGCRTCLILTTYNRNLLEREGLVDLAVESLSEFARHIGIHL